MLGYYHGKKSGWIKLWKTSPSLSGCALVPLEVANLAWTLPGFLQNRLRMARFRLATCLALRRAIDAVDHLQHRCHFHFCFCFDLYRTRCTHAMIVWSQIHLQTTKIMRTAVMMPPGGCFGRIRNMDTELSDTLIQTSASLPWYAPNFCLATHLLQICSHQSCWCLLDQSDNMKTYKAKSHIQQLAQLPRSCLCCNLVFCSVFAWIQDVLDIWNGARQDWC